MRDESLGAQVGLAINNVVYLKQEKKEELATAEEKSPNPRAPTKEPPTKSS